MRGATLIIVSVFVLVTGASRAEEREKRHRIEPASDVKEASDVQESAEKLGYRVRLGDTLFVQTGSGGRIRGRLEDFGGDRLRIDGRSFSLSQGDVRRIEMRVDDSVANGGLIGAGIGTGMALLTCAADGGDYDEFFLTSAWGTSWFAKS